MKVMFFFNWEFTYLCHALAIKLKEKYGVDDTQFSGMVVQKKEYEFLKNQKDIRYSYLGLIPDYTNPKEVLNQEIDIPYLKNLEKKYGIPNLWLLVYGDRNLVLYNKFFNYSHEDSMKFLQSCFKYTIDFIEKTKPDVIFYDCIGSLPAYVLYQVAKVHGVKNLIITAGRTGRKIVFGNDPLVGFNRVIETFKKKQVESKHKLEAAAFLKEFRLRTIKPEYMVTGEQGIERFFSVTRQLGKVPRMFEYFYNYYFGDYQDDYNYYRRTLAKVGLERVRQNIRRLSVVQKTVFETPNYSENYAFFPLHLEPETSTMVGAPMYINQIALIENIARSLPIDFKLYVKEHPLATLLGVRELDYYKQLKKIPNLRLISPKVDIIELVKHSKLICVINGTTGWEGVLLKKPVITFAEVFYSHLSFVRYCNDLPRLPVLIKETLETYAFTKAHETELEEFLGSLFQNSFDINLCEMYGQSDPIPFEKVLAHPELPILVEKFAEEVGIVKSRKRII